MGVGWPDCPVPGAPADTAHGPGLWGWPCWTPTATLWPLMLFLHLPHIEHPSLPMSCSSCAVARTLLSASWGTWRSACVRERRQPDR